MTTDNNRPATEFSRLQNVTSLPAKGQYFQYQLTGEERKNLAGRYGIISIDSLESKGKIIPSGKGKFKLKATFEANITQTCGISLDPVREEISGEFSVLLHHQSQKRQQQPTEIDINPSGDDVEYLEGDVIDIGELIAQHISLEINPYPRKQGATGDELGQKIFSEEDHHSDLKKQNPFNILKTLQE